MKAEIPKHLPHVIAFHQDIFKKLSVVELIITAGEDLMTDDECKRYTDFAEELSELLVRYGKGLDGQYMLLGLCAATRVALESLNNSILQTLDAAGTVQ